MSLTARTEKICLKIKKSTNLMDRPMVSIMGISSNADIMYKAIQGHPKHGKEIICLEIALKECNQLSLDFHYFLPA